MTYQVHQGACRCGKVRFEATGEPQITTACHCTGCQRMTSSAFSLSALYAADRFEVTQGETVIGGLHSEQQHHHFCGDCMSWLFTRFEAMPDLVNVRATLLDNAQVFRPFMETYTCEGLPWAKTGAVRSFEKFPEMQDYPELLAEYAAART